MAREVRVPRVRMHELGTAAVGGHREVDGHRLEGRVRALQRVPRTKRDGALAICAEATHLDVDPLRKLAREVLHVHACAAVDLGWIFAGEEDGFHPRHPTGRSRSYTRFRWRR